MGDFYSLLLALGKADDDFNTGKVSFRANFTVRID